jgi:hypothetical protein
MIWTEKQENLFDINFGNHFWIDAISISNMAVSTGYFPVSISLS